MKHIELGSTAKEFLSAVNEVFGGGVAAWLLKLVVAGITAAKSAGEHAALPFFITLFMLGIDALLGTILAIKEGGMEAVKPWRWISGPAMKALVGGLALVLVSFIDVWVMKSEPGSMAPALYIVAGVMMSAVGIDAIRKVDKLWNIGIGRALARLNPAMFGPKENKPSDQ